MFSKGNMKSFIRVLIALCWIEIVEINLKFNRSDYQSSLSKRTCKRCSWFLLDATSPTTQGNASGTHCKSFRCHRMHAKLNSISALSLWLHFGVKTNDYWLQFWKATYLSTFTNVNNISMNADRNLSNQLNLKFSDYNDIQGYQNYGDDVIPQKTWSTSKLNDGINDEFHCQSKENIMQRQYTMKQMVRY